jgi:hypothetical protein
MSNSTTRRDVLFWGAAILAAVSAPAIARPEPILTLSGGGGEPRDFDRATLEGLGTAKVLTTTPWTEGVQEFEGVLLRTVLNTSGRRGTVAFMKALNEYKIELPLQDAEKWPVLLAMKRNGKYMPVRDKGPLWVIYPIDDDPVLRSPAVADRMIWQLRSIEVR